MENQDLCVLWDLWLQILTTWRFRFYTLSYWSPIHLISIEFQNIDNNLGTLPKNFFVIFNCYDLAICVVTLTGTFSTNYRSFRANSFLINSKRRRWIFLEIMKAYSRKTKNFIVAPKMALHWHESHSMIYSFRIGLIRGR